MRVGQSTIFEVVRNGISYRTFSARQVAINYLAAARDLCPDCEWTLREVPISDGR